MKRLVLPDGDHTQLFTLDASAQPLTSSTVEFSPVLASAILVLAYMALLFVLSSAPRRSGPGASLLSQFVELVPSSIQKVMHVVLYGGLAWLWFFAFGFLHIESASSVVLAFVLTTGYGAFNEWRQLHVEGRYGSLKDVLLNSLGAVLGLLLAIFY